MNIPLGLKRISVAFKILGFLCAIPPLIAFLNNARDVTGITVIFAIPGIVLWVIGWIIHGFSGRS